VIDTHRLASIRVISMSKVPSAGVWQLDPDLYRPTEAEVAFFKRQTGIDGDEELKEHIVKIQHEAWDVVHYGCIRNFGFTKLRIKMLPGYANLLRLAQVKSDAIFLDFACAFGVDTRAAIADGYRVENVVASDLQQVFWYIGHKLFRSTPQSFPVPFVQGNVFDPKHIAPASPLYTPPSTPRPDLSSLDSLIPLQGHVSAIHVAAFFHLFQEDDQLKAARALASLLSSEKGSFIFGSHGALRKKGVRKTPNPRGSIFTATTAIAGGTCGMV